MSEDVIAENVTSADDELDAETEAYFTNQGDVDDAPDEVDPEPKEETAEESSEDQKEDATDENDSHSQNYKAAMFQEREKRKALQRDLEANKAEVQRVKERFDQIMYQQQQGEAGEEVPDPDTDPLGAIQYQNQKLAEAMEQQQQIEYQRQQEVQQQQQAQQFMGQYSNTAKEFAKENPDFSDAYSHLMQSRQSELETAGYTREQALQVMRQDEYQIVNNAFQTERNPAEVMYQLAKQRGYVGKAPEVPESDKKLETIKRGSAASKTLTGTGGGKRSGSPGFDELMDMSDEDFAKLDWKKLNRGMA